MLSLVLLRNLTNSGSRMAGAVFQNAFYVGVNLNAILYGIELTLYLMSILPFMRLRVHNLKTSDLYTLSFSTAVFLLATVFVAVQAAFGEEIWIINADFLGGNDAYLAAHSAVWYQTLGRAAFVALSLLTDGLMIYRCFETSADRRVITWTCLLYAATLVLGTLALASSGVSPTTPFPAMTKTFTLIYSAILTALNITVTAINSTRVLSSELTGHGFLAVTSAICIESALPFTLSGIAFLVSYAIGSQLSIPFLFLYAMASCVCPHLIILHTFAEQRRPLDRPRLSVLINTRVSVSHPPTAHVQSSTDSYPPVGLRNVARSDMSAFGDGKW